MVRKATEFLLRLKGKRWPYVTVAVVSLVVSCCTLVADRTVTEEGERKVTETTVRVDWERALERIDVALRHLERNDVEGAKAAIGECKECITRRTAPTE